MPSRAVAVSISLSQSLVLTSNLTFLALTKVLEFIFKIYDKFSECDLITFLKLKKN